MNNIISGALDSVTNTNRIIAKYKNEANSLEEVMEGIKSKIPIETFRELDEEIGNYAAAAIDTYFEEGFKQGVKFVYACLEDREV